MSEYFVGQPGRPRTASDPAGPHTVGTQAAHAETRVRFGLPFNGIIPIWHDGTDITWHRLNHPLDPADIVGLGYLETIPGPSPVPPGWSERVEIGTLIPTPTEADDEHADSTSTGSDQRGLTLRLRATTQAGRDLLADTGNGVDLPLSPALGHDQTTTALPSDVDRTGFAIHIARLMLRAARDRAILLFTLRAPRDPEAHHLLSIPSDVDSDGVMHFHLGTLLEMDGGAWEQAHHQDGMALLDLDVPYDSLRAGQVDAASSAAGAPESLLSDRLIDMAQPVVDVLLRPGFPFALGCSVVLPQ